MDFDTYQIDAHVTSLNTIIGHPVIYPTLGLAGEVGEVSEKIKKVFRDCEGDFPKEVLDDLTKELGDILWYISEIATVLGLSLDDIAKENLFKLWKRKSDDLLHGNGDNR